MSRSSVRRSSFIIVCHGSVWRSSGTSFLYFGKNYLPTNIFFSPLKIHHLNVFILCEKNRTFLRSLELQTCTFSWPYFRMAPASLEHNLTVYICTLYLFFPYIYTAGHTRHHPSKCKNCCDAAFVVSTRNDSVGWRDKK